MRPRMLKAISLAENVRTPWLSTCCATTFDDDMRPVPLVHLCLPSQVSNWLMLYGRNNSPDNSAGKAEVLASTLRAPPRKERLE